MRVGIIDRFGASFKNKIPTTVRAAETWYASFGALRTVRKKKEKRETRFIYMYIYIWRTVYFLPGVSRDWGLSIALGDVPRRAARRRQLSRPPFPPSRRRARRSPSSPSPSRSLPCSRGGGLYLIRSGAESKRKLRSLGISHSVATSGRVQQRHAHVRGMLSVCWTGGGSGSSRMRRRRG